MKTLDAIKHFGSQRAVASVLQIKQPSVCRWGDFPPDKRQIQLSALSGGRLKPEPGCVERVMGFTQPSEA